MNEIFLPHLEVIKLTLQGPFERTIAVQRTAWTFATWLHILKNLSSVVFHLNLLKFERC